MSSGGENSGDLLRFTKYSPRILPEEPPVEEPRTGEIKRNLLNGRTYKNIFRVGKRKGEPLLRRDDDTVTEVGEKHQSSSCQGQRAVSHQTQACSSDAVHDRDILGVACSHDKYAWVAHNGELTRDQDHAHSSDYQQDIEMENECKTCTVCSHGGKLISCDGRGCGRSFHLCCVDPPFTYFPPGVWHCIWCVRRKMELGVYCVSEGIESILDADGVSDDEGMQKQYLVKYKGLAHVHSCWIARTKLLLKAPAVFSRYKRQKKRVSRWKREWMEPERLLAKRLLILPEQFNSNVQENDYCRHEWLVKWTGLGYNQATWELEDAQFLSTPESMKLISDFATRHMVTEEANHADETKRRKLPYGLPKLPCGGSVCMTYVNKLLEYWHRDRNALIIDSQERLTVVCLFLLSLLKEMSGPFLIVTTPTALPMWEAEFRRWATPVNIVSYNGNGETRDLIRKLEFYNERGCIMFEVLLSPSVAVVEDFEKLKPIKWNVIVVDDFQRPTLSFHAEKIKMLTAKMRLLVVNSQIKDWSINYHNALSLLDSNHEGFNEDFLEDDGNIDTSKMKENLAEFTAYERKRGTVKLMEFWVPVMLSDLQAEQYCAFLYSNSNFLCSSSKKDQAFSLHDLLKTTRKCCDHPYLVDQSLMNLELQGKRASDHLDIEIQMSGKLQLLNKILPEIQRRGLRAVILFQEVDCSGGIPIGHILDDFMDQKFGANSYSRIDGQLYRNKKQAAFDVFNNKANGNFVLLMETRSCLPRTKISSVDTIIIFNSDWDPVNDLKALQKISIESQFEQLKIFRLYSSVTVEEKALILAKEGVTVDSKIKRLKQSTCQKLLTWGSSCLFRRLDESDELSATLSHSSNSREQTILEDVIQELSTLLACSSVEEGSTLCSSRQHNSNVLSVQLSEAGTYQGNNLCLVGELNAQTELLDGPPRVFWRNLLQGRKPRWKYVSSSQHRIRRKTKLISSLAEESEEHVMAARKRMMEANCTSKRTLKWKFAGREGLQGGEGKKKLADDVPQRGEVAAEKFGHHAGEGPEIARPVSDSVQQAGTNLSTEPATTLFERGEPDAAANLVPENINPNFSSNHYSEAPSGRLQVAQSAWLVSLQQEMNRIQEAKEQAAKYHEDLKVGVKSECEKELEEVCKKYNLLLKQAESVLAKQQSELESCYLIIQKQMLLAEAMLKLDHIPAADPQGQEEVTLATLTKSIYEFCSMLPTRRSSEEFYLPPEVQSNSSDAEQQATASNPAIPEGGESVNPHTAIGSPETSAQAVGSTSAGWRIADPAGLGAEVLQPGAGGSTEERGQPSANLVVTQTQSGLEHSSVTSSSRCRPPPLITTIRSSGDLGSRRETRAPAPHSRTTLPGTRAAAPHLRTTLPGTRAPAPHLRTTLTGYRF